jgi:hypothetical protein
MLAFVLCFALSSQIIMSMQYYETSAIDVGTCSNLNGYYFEPVQLSTNLQILFHKLQ